MLRERSQQACTPGGAPGPYSVSALRCQKLTYPLKSTGVMYFLFISSKSLMFCTKSLERDKTENITLVYTWQTLNSLSKECTGILVRSTGRAPPPSTVQWFCTDTLWPSQVTISSGHLHVFWALADVPGTRVRFWTKETDQEHSRTQELKA